MGETLQTPQMLYVPFCLKVVDRLGFAVYASLIADQLYRSNFRCVTAVLCLQLWRHELVVQHMYRVILLCSAVLVIRTLLPGRALSECLAACGGTGIRGFGQASRALLHVRACVDRTAACRGIRLCGVGHAGGSACLHGRIV